MEVAGDWDCDCDCIKMLCWSSRGESGTACGKPEDDVFTREGNCEGEGIWSDNPLPSTSGLLPARGVSGTELSSLLLAWRSRSWKVGEGWRALGAEDGSEKERDLEGVLEGESTMGAGGRSMEVSMVSHCCRQWLACVVGRQRWIRARRLSRVRRLVARLAMVHGGVL